MKKHQYRLIFLFTLLFSLTAQAEVKNYVGAYANLGEWSLLAANSKYSTSFGVAGGLGFQYELRVGPKYSQTHFLLDLGVGAWGGMTSFIQGSNQNITLPNQTDLDGDNFDYVYELQNRQDKYNNLALQMPSNSQLDPITFYFLPYGKGS